MLVFLKVLEKSPENETFVSVFAHECVASLDV